MKRLAFVSLSLFWIITLTVLAAGLIVGNNSITISTSFNPSASPTSTQRTPLPSPSSNPKTTQPTIALTAQEVAKHNTANDCWMIISGNVYDFTSYIPGHPGGSAMVPYCGTDATTVFLSGPPHYHSSFAQSLLSNYSLGNLNTHI